MTLRTAIRDWEKDKPITTAPHLEDLVKEATKVTGRDWQLIENLKGITLVPQWFWHRAVPNPTYELCMFTGSFPPYEVVKLTSQEEVIQAYLEGVIREAKEWQE